MACVCLASAGACGPASAEITDARYTGQTTRYDHGILGDAVEWGALELSLTGGQKLRAVLPETMVFEDTAPRLADVDGDGDAEIIVIESSLQKGARLAVWDETGRLAATPYIGRSHRWLAPIGAADLDGDGRVEIGYIDRPHLAKTLRVWRFDQGELTHVADLPGLTNHKIGWDFIPGGIRDCGLGPEMITADSRWRNIMATRLTGGMLEASIVGSYDRPDDLYKALNCP
jgi:hypothetical protein